MLDQSYLSYLRIEALSSGDLDQLLSYLSIELKLLIRRSDIVSNNTVSYNEVIRIRDEINRLELDLSKYKREVLVGDTSFKLPPDMNYLKTWKKFT